MRVVIARTEAYTMTEECLRIARGLTAQGLYMFGQDEGGVRMKIFRIF